VWCISEKIKCPQCGRRLFDLKSRADFEVDASIERILAGTGELLEPEIAAILFGNER